MENVYSISGTTIPHPHTYTNYEHILPEEILLIPANNNYKSQYLFCLFLSFDLSLFLPLKLTRMCEKMEKKNKS